MKRRMVPPPRLGGGSEMRKDLVLVDYGIQLACAVILDVQCNV